MRTLYLLRHAKSSWKDETQADFERPLAGRGRKACIIVAQLFQVKKIELDLIICSTAVRARETIDLVRQYTRLKTELRFDERIYEADTSRLLEVVSQIDPDRKSVLLVGHNPGFEDLVHELTGKSERLPTAALVKIKLKTSKWSEPYAGNASLDWIVRPKELEDS
jgi:phosphohistidine phosphatase